MTREQATQNINEIDFLTWQIDIIEDMLDQIFNDHEAQPNVCKLGLETQDKYRIILAITITIMWWFESTYNEG